VQQHKLREGLLDVTTTILLLIAVAAIVIPILAMFLTSIQPPVVARAPGIHLAFSPEWVNYRNLLLDEGFMRSLLNSLIVATGHTALAILVSFPSAYALSRSGNFRGKFLIALWIMATRCLPPIGIAIPFYIIFQQLGIYNTHFGLMVLYLTLNVSFGVMMLRSYLRNVPIEIDESAVIDGATLHVILAKIILPVIRPGIVATGIFVFTVSWNEFMFAFLFTSFRMRTAPVEISQFITPMGVQWTEMSAAGMLVIAPIIIFAIAIRRHFVSGLTMGALKN